MDNGGCRRDDLKLYWFSATLCQANTKRQANSKRGRGIVYGFGARWM